VACVTEGFMAYCPTNRTYFVRAVGTTKAMANKQWVVHPDYLKNPQAEIVPVIIRVHRTDGSEAIDL